MRRLTIVGCNFGGVDEGVVVDGEDGRVGDDEGGVLEEGLVGVVEMVVADREGYRLREIGLEVVEGRRVPERVVRAVERLERG